MALDRQDIEKRDFPIGRRGYDPDAVDAHLREIAEEVEALRRQAATSAPHDDASLAATASEQVKAIVDAAETTAAGIQREAEERARDIRQQAADEADETRDGAASQAREHVAKVVEATSVMLLRVDAIEGELGGLLESLRTGANGLIADLALLQGNVGELRAATGNAGDGLVEEAPADAAVEPEAADAEPQSVEESPADPDGDSEGARLIALNMALNGTPREDTERYLADNFDIPDRDALLDEVYARVG